ncbi:MAG: NINE protein [Oscillospiraceae bacterium]|jgi:TM2 domain-containing membrane protein YozV|nr:NINE protein [Oscillospiraceae bacterium]
MALNKCPQCGAAVEPNARECKYCGEPLAPEQPQASAPQVQYIQQPQVVYVQNQQSPYDPNWPIKSKIVAGILAIIFGGIGIHKFYLGRTGQGILYLIFCWTGIPEFVGFIEGIIYLCSNDHNFQVKNRVRIN